MKHEKELNSVSLRVREAAELLLTSLIEQVGNFPSLCGAHSASCLLDEASLLHQSPLGQEDDFVEQSKAFFVVVVFVALFVDSCELVPMEQQEEEPSQSAQQPEQQEECDLSVQEATKIHSVITQQLLPQLNKILTARSKRDMQHKAVKDHFPEDDEILRVPIALALVTLLKNLPPGAPERNLPG